MTDDNKPIPDAPTPAPPEPLPAAVADHPEPQPHLVADATEAPPPSPAAEPPVETAATVTDRAADATEPAPEPTPTPAEEAPSEPKKPAKRTRKAKAAAEASPEQPADGTAAPAASPAIEGAADTKKKWYVVKVTSGREDTIKAAIERKVKIEGLEEFFGQIAIPVEELVQKKSVRVTDKKTGEKVTQEKKVVKYQKKFPGYIFAEVEFNDRILYLFRETSGVGDFVGAGGPNPKPTAMTDREVRAMLVGLAEGELPPNQKQRVKLDYEKGDKVKIRDGAFANMEGIVKSITETKDTGETPKVKVEVTIFGRPVEVDLDYWHVDKA